MIKVLDVYPWKWNNPHDTETCNAMLDKTPGINFPGLYDNIFIGLHVEMTTVEFVNRLNFEQNVLFKEREHTSNSNEIIISIAEAISLIYELTILPIQRQRLVNSLRSIDQVVDLVRFYLIENNPQCISKFMYMYMPDTTVAWTAYSQEKSYKDRFTKLAQVQRGKTSFTDIQYSSVPIKTWFNNGEELLDIVDKIEDYRCIETVYYYQANDPVIEKLVTSPDYKIIMCGSRNESNAFNTVTLLVSDKPIKEDIELIKESYKDFYKN